MGQDNVRMIDEAIGVKDSVEAQQYRQLGIDSVQQFMGAAVDNLQQAKAWARSTEAAADLHPVISNLFFKAQVVVDKMQEMR